MVNALVQLSAETNRILNTVKAAKGLKTKGAAIEYVAKQFAEKQYIAFDHDGRQFKPQFVKEVLDAEKRIERGEGVSYTPEQHAAEIRRLEALVRSRTRKATAQAGAKSAAARRSRTKKS